MSGHSKWNNIKRVKEKSDAQKGKIFTKCVKEISMAIKEGGGADPETNSRLSAAIAKARQSNMPNDSIMRNIKKFSAADSVVNYEEVLYEGYGTGGVAVIVDSLTDNRNRTASDVRHAFDKFGGSLGTNGSVDYIFNRQGIIVVNKENVDYDKLFELVLENDGFDIDEQDDGYVVITSPETFSKVSNALTQANYKVESAEVEYIPTNCVELDDNKKETFKKMLDQLNELDDVSEVYHNASNIEE